VIKKIEVGNEKCMEPEYLKTLNHPNIVRYVKSFVESSVLFFVMEHCEDTIEFSAQRVTGEMGLNEDEIKFIGRQVLHGLSYLHSNHIVHRDIKPSNILKTGSGFIKIADFGDAQFITANQRSEKFDMGSLYGTPHFMAPECLHKAKVGPSADIWSFGCVLVYLISGKLPWQNCDNKFNVLFKLGSFKELPVNVDTLECSSAIKAVLSSIFQIDPADRPTAVDLLRTDYFSKAIDSLI
jgi:serine/threonine protein kinase